MNILFFFGSGVSNLPGVTEITRRIFAGDLYDNTQGTFQSYPKPTVISNHPNLAAKSQEFLEYLKNYNENYLKEGINGETTYEDLFYLARIVYLNRGKNNQDLTADLMQRIQKDKRNLFGTFRGKKVDIELISETSLDLIHHVVSSSLRTEEVPKGFSVLEEVIGMKYFDSIDIVTLNHDLVLESILNNHNVNYVDGFSKPKNDIGYFDPTLFQSDTRLKLYKLHGSINWFRVRNIEKNKDFIITTMKNDKEHLKDHENSPLLLRESFPVLLTGSYNKLQAYKNEMIYSELQSIFDKVLHNHNIMFMSGYGWNDVGINKKLFDWLDSSNNKKLVLLHKNPNSIREKSNSQMDIRYELLVQEGKLIPVKKWFSNYSLPEMKELLNNINGT